MVSWIRQQAAGRRLLTEICVTLDRGRQRSWKLVVLVHCNSNRRRSVAVGTKLFRPYSMGVAHDLIHCGFRTQTRKALKATLCRYRCRSTTAEIEARYTRDEQACGGELQDLCGQSRQPQFEGR